MAELPVAIRYNSSPTKAGIARYAGGVDSPQAWDLIQRLGSGMSVFLAANFKACGLPLPAGLRETDDAYAEAPATIRNEHSLHVFEPRSITKGEELVQSLRQTGGLIVLFSQLDRAALLKELKLYLAWFARPATLRMQFENGSEFLAEKLLSGLHAVLIEAAPGQGWIVYANPKVVPDWQAVGFPNPPQEAATNT
jgi:hypothetical protein